MNPSTVLITGSTDGIGKATALQLARQGWKVVVHGRSERRCQIARDEIRKTTGNREIEYLCADLASLGEVRRMAKKASGGQYFDNHRIASPSAAALDKKLQHGLWDLSELLCDHRYAPSKSGRYTEPGA